MNKSFLATSPADLHRALEEEKEHIREQEIGKQANLLHLPYINLRGFPIDLTVLGLFTEQEARQFQAVPFFREHHDLRIAAVEPGNALLKEKIKELQQKYTVTLHLISPASLEHALHLYAKVLVLKPEHESAVKISKPINPDEFFAKMNSGQAQEAMTTSELINNIYASAVALAASDIHLEPEENFVKLRFRLDGVLQDMLHISKKLQRTLTARIKILSKLKLNVENMPQDGRMTFFVQNEPVDVRVSTLPSAYGEGIVLRLLGIGAINLKLNELGLRGKAYEHIEHILGQPNGMVITTGPTGSGKTTTLYAFLNELNKPGVKVITLEDPVEYKLEGISQTPIDHNVDFNFAKGLRAILRQDPDIVMVGEIRDQETAETALQASLTGHLVLSTLHTNDAAGAIPRLISMGVKPFVIAPALNAVIAQRLVRKLCPDCKEAAKLPAALLARVEDVLKQIPVGAGAAVPGQLQFYRSRGCSQCHNLGYRGRIGVYEVLPVTDEVRELILKESSGVQLKQLAIKEGMATMVQDGLLKALEGITDVEEVFRVTGE